MPATEGWTVAPGHGLLNIVWFVPIAVWVAALLVAAIAIWRAPGPITLSVVIDKLLRYLFFFPLGVQGLWAFVGHVIYPQESAASIGWAPSPFQYEVGVANLGLALASFYAAFSGFQARAATAIAVACFLVGAGLGHIQDIVEEGNFAPGNAGPIMITDFLTPIVILVLLLVLPRTQAKPAAITTRLEEELETARKAIGSHRTSLRKPPK